jgi:hypothetical protein
LSGSHPRKCITEDGGELGKGFELAVADGEKRRGRSGVLEGCREFTSGSEGGIIGREPWHGNFGRKEFHHVNGALAAGAVDEYPEAAIVFRRGPDVPSFFAMWRPGSALRWFFVGDDASARRCKWRGIVIERAVELGVGRKTWVDARISQEIQGEDSFWTIK